MTAHATVLIVDDRIEELQAFITLLEGSGFRIVVTKDGETAIQRAAHVSPDMILLDVLMPSPDGRDSPPSGRKNS